MKRFLRKLADFLKMLVFLGAVALLSAWFASQAEVALEGRAKVLDGDSLMLNGQEIRLLGLDAPEYQQSCTSSNAQNSTPCGRQAIAHLKSLIKAQAISCEGWEKDKYDRLLAICRVGKVNLNREMVASGWAVAFGDYEREEAEARSSNLGIWAGTFEKPEEWRRKSREAHSIHWVTRFKFW